MVETGGKAAQDEREWPGITRWLLVQQIQAYRLRAGLTYKQMAGVGLGSESRWNRIEGNKGGFALRPGDIQQMRKVFRLSDVEADELEDMRARAGAEVNSQIPAVQPTFREYLAFERHAVGVDSLGGMHGLIQTPLYAAATARLDGAHGAAADVVVALRMERQRLTLGRAKLRVALDEEVLLREVESKQVMDELKEHLLRLVREDYAQIRVHLISSGAHSAVRGAATILRFTAGGQSRAIVYTESWVGGAHTDDRQVVASMNDKFQTVFDSSTPIEEYL